jgi:hypothetical protein
MTNRKEAQPAGRGVHKCCPEKKLRSRVSLWLDGEEEEGVSGWRTWTRSGPYAHSGENNKK